MLIGVGFRDDDDDDCFKVAQASRHSGYPQLPAGISLESTQVTLNSRIDIVPAK